MNTLRKIYCRTFQKAFKFALPFLPYRNPEVIGSVKSLPEILLKKKCANVLIITDKGIRSLGLTERLEKTLKENNISYSIYDKTVANPTTVNVKEAENLWYQSGCKAIIGFGGGSSMDCAKAVAARIAKPHQSLAQMKGILKIHKKLPLLIAIPTTAGTGSETTLAAVITDAETRYKYAINDFPLIPRYAVLDPKVTLSLPPFITATTGMDALTHAVEAYIGNSTTPGTRKNALDAVQLIFENLDRAYTNGSDKEARKNMLRASYFAGCAFTKSYVGYVHAVAHTLGGQYNVPHGLANAVILPFVLEEYGKTIYSKLARLAQAAGVADSSTPEKEAAHAFIQAVKDMKKRFNIGDTILEIKEEDIPKLAHYADKEGNPLYPVPVLMDAHELEKFYYILMDKKQEDTSNDIHKLIEKQRADFYSNETLNIEKRIHALKKLKTCIQKNEAEIATALEADLGKSNFESYMCETGLVLSEISYMLKHIRRFTREKRVHTPLSQFHSRSFTKPGPYGVVLIMSPWNYPFLLSLDPLIDAIAAGNTVILKPSAYSPNTSKLIEKMIRECFSPEMVAVVTGGRAENTSLLEEHFDYIFFTGSQNVGREVMRKSSAHLTPVTLELGGKSPCIVDESADLKLAARRIVFGKYLNCGQTCVAPDYICCHSSVKDAFLAEVKKQISLQFGEQPLSSSNYGKIINEKHFHRISGLIDHDKVIFGGHNDRNTLRIEPTVMDHVTYEDKVMQEEIFGPVMPVLTYNSLDELIGKINSMPHPLALYFFTRDKVAARKVTSQCQFGGGCINDTIIHLATSEMPFGGFGESGMGGYHGREGFRTFSHYKSIVDKKTWLDLPMRYQPYKRINDKLIHFFLK